VPDPDVLALHAGIAPERTAVIEGDDRTTYAELNDEVNRLASGLLALGIRRGDCAVWCGPNSREVVAFVHAARKVGLVAVPVSYRFTPDEMRYLVENSEAALVVVDAEYAPHLASAIEGLGGVRAAVVYRGTQEGFVSWDEVLAKGSPDEPESAGDDAVGSSMIYTSGTTGKPKGARRTTSDRDTVVALLHELRYGLGDEEIHLTTGPLYHSGPLAFAVLAHSVGGSVVIMRSFDAATWVRLVREHRVTSTFSAPTQLKRIVSLPDDVLVTADLSSMRTLIANAAPVPYALKQEVIAKLGDGFLFEVYGSTELGVDTVLVPEDQLRKPGSCGRPYGGIEIKVVDDDGNALPAGQPGELFVRSPLAIDGYHATEERLAELGGEWKSVGDVAYVDDEGYVYICDRKKDMIITGGMNVYPAEIEAVLHAHPDVMDVAVFGIPDDEWGERVHAVVQPRAGATIDLDALAAYAEDHLANYKRPRSWQVRDQLPRTESGKLLKRVLRDEHWAGRSARV
jgi:acyl-CoA synthetase (AMP-forming)/AMP-acid ligase II